MTSKKTAHALRRATGTEAWSKSILLMVQSETECLRDSQSAHLMRLGVIHISCATCMQGGIDSQFNSNVDLESPLLADDFQEL
jgi:hypothetical protein